MNKTIYEKRIILPIILLLILILGGCGDKSIGEKSTQNIITDSAKNKVIIPTKVERVADAWPAHQEVVTMLGAGEKIKATVDTKGSMPWLYVVNPAFKSAKTVFISHDVNIESLMKTKPDIIFTSANSILAKKLQSTGIPVVQLFFNDFSGLKECFRTTGIILGPKAKVKADEYNAYLDEKINKIKTITKKFSKKQRPRILHICSLTPLVVDGENTIIDSWIKLAGGTNAATDLIGNLKPVTKEQILAWNPDVIILGNNALPLKNNGTHDLEKFLTDPAWQGINAVKNKKVYINPAGAFLWDRYGAEEALQIQWAAKIFHPDQFKNINMLKETQYFYKKFMNYDLSTDQAKKIISGELP